VRLRLRISRRHPPRSSASDTARRNSVLSMARKFHLLMLHFPIALIMRRGWGSRSFWKTKSGPVGIGSILPEVGSNAAIPTVGLGGCSAAAGNGVGPRRQILTPPVGSGHGQRSDADGYRHLLGARCAPRPNEVVAYDALTCGVLLTG